MQELQEAKGSDDTAQPLWWKSLCELALVGGREEEAQWHCPAVTPEQLKRQKWLRLGGRTELQGAAIDGELL